jgi:hypothetical protein
MFVWVMLVHHASNSAAAAEQQCIGELRDPPDFLALHQHAYRDALHRKRSAVLLPLKYAFMAQSFVTGWLNSLLAARQSSESSHAQQWQRLRLLVLNSRQWRIRGIQQFVTCVLIG